MKKRQVKTSSNAGFILQVAVLALCFLVGATVISQSYYERDLAQQRAALRLDGEVMLANLEVIMGDLLRITESMRATLEARPDITQAEFSQAAAVLVEQDRTERGYPEIINIGGAPDLVLSLIYPIETNRSVLGLDYRTLENQLPAVRAALLSRRPVISGPVDLVQGGTAMLIRISVQPLGTAESWGIVSIVVDRDQLFKNVGLTAQAGQFDFVVTRISSPDNLENPFGIIAGNARVLENDPVTIDFNHLSGVAWQLSLTPSSGWLTHSSQRHIIWLACAALACFLIGIIGFMRRGEKRTRLAERNLSQAIGAIDDGFAMYGADDRLIICNKKYLEYYPRSAAQITQGKTFREILQVGLDKGEYRDAVGREEEWLEERMIAHAAADTRVIQELADGRWIKISEARLDDGSTVGFRVDITELVKARELAENSDWAKTSFLNRMSHELRTPLSIMLGYNSFLLQPDRLADYKELAALVEKPENSELAEPLKKLAKEISDKAAKVNTSGGFLLGMIDKILEFASSDDTRAELEPEKLDIGAITNALGSIYTDKSASQAVSLVVNARAASLVADLKLIERALACLFRHGIEIVEQGELSVDVINGPESVDIIFDSVGKIRNAGLTIDVFNSVNTQSEDDDSTKLSLDLAIVDRLLFRIGGKLAVTDMSATHRRVAISLNRNAAAIRSGIGIVKNRTIAAE